MEDSDVFEAEDFYPQALDAFRWQGEQLCLPQNVSSLVVYYNRDLFERYGVPEPRAGWTWGELVDAASALTRDANGNVVKGTRDARERRQVAVYGLGVEPAMIRVAPFVWSNGGEIVDDETLRRGSPSTPRGAEALKDFLDLRSVYGVVPTDEEVEAEDDEARFANGRLAMLLDVASGHADVPHDRRLRLGRCAVAGATQQPAGHPALRRLLHDRRLEAQGRGLAVHGVRARPEGQEIVAETGRTVPSLIAVSRSDAFLDPSQPPDELAGLPGRHPDPPPRADDLDLAGDRGRHRGDPGERAVPGDAGGRGDPRARRGDATAVRPRARRP